MMPPFVKIKSHAQNPARALDGPTLYLQGLTIKQGEAG